MRLDEYQWTHNPRGMHNKRAANFFDVERLAQMKMGWGKIIAVDREFMNVIPKMLANNITPIVRIWRPRFGATPFTYWPGPFASVWVYAGMSPVARA